jgi:hypothetical protein
MDEYDNKQEREEIYSIVVRAGKRTYFFDVKETRAKEKYLTITESKRRFNNDSGKFFYEKHKLFLYKEDFEKFADGLSGVIDFIKANPGPEQSEDSTAEKSGEVSSFTVADTPGDESSGIADDDLFDDKSDDSGKEEDKF